uniref:Uncharacterized protein n=1 Tax=Parascaris univalens TaxID=6257 RepID=A0A915BS30_PARUN
TTAFVLCCLYAEIRPLECFLFLEIAVFYFIWHSVCVPLNGFQSFDTSCRVESFIHGPINGGVSSFILILVLTVKVLLMHFTNCISHLLLCTLAYRKLRCCVCIFTNCFVDACMFIFVCS